jgi:hypothetical protein
MSELTADGGAPELPVAFADGSGDVVVNFGLLTGREATQAELDRLARSLQEAGAAEHLAISAVRRQEYGPRVEAVAAQVHVSADGEHEAVVELCRAWVLECAEDRRVEPLA